MTAEQKLTEIINFLKWGSIDYDHYHYSMESIMVNGSSKIKLEIQLKEVGKNFTHLNYFIDHAQYFTKPEVMLCMGGVVTITITDDLWVELVLYFLAKVLKMELEVLICAIDVIKVMDTPSPESTASILFRFEPDVPPEIRRSIMDELKNCYLYCYSSNPMEYRGEQYNIEMKDSAIILPNNQVYVELNISKTK